MKKVFLYCLLLFALLIAACTYKEDSTNADPVDTTPKETEPVKNNPIEKNGIKHELLFHLEYLPPEVGTTISVIQDDTLYQSWAEIFQFDSVPVIDFDKEEVLFVTTYANSCGLIFENVTLQEDTLMVKLNFPKHIRDKGDIACNDIAIPQAFVVKMEKTGAVYGTLMDANRILIEKDSVIQ